MYPICREMTFVVKNDVKPQYNNCIQCIMLGYIISKPNTRNKNAKCVCARPRVCVCVCVFVFVCVWSQQLV